MSVASSRLGLVVAAFVGLVLVGCGSGGASHVSTPMDAPDGTADVADVPSPLPDVPPPAPETSPEPTEDVAEDAAEPPPPPPPPHYEGTFPTSPGFGEVTLSVAGLDRDMEVYVPVALASPPSLVIAFHGTSGGMHDSFDGTEIQELADSHGFVVVAPASRWWGEGQGDWDNHSGNDRWWETWPNVDPDANADLVLVRAIIAEAETRYGVDPKRIYTFGFSNGGFFSLFVAMILRDEIAAFAEAASGLVTCPTTGDCGFVGEGATCEALSKVEGWCACDGQEKPVPIPTTGRIPPGILAHNTVDYTVSVYYSCALQSRMQALGGEAVLDLWTDGDASHAIEPNFMTKAWAFFEAHPLGP